MPRRARSATHMDSRALDYPGVLSKLVGFQGRETDFGVRGVDDRPPLFVYATGDLSAGEVYGGEIVGYDRDALNVTVDAVQATLHPEHFVSGVWLSDGQRVQMLRIAMGTVALEFRTGL